MNIYRKSTTERNTESPETGNNYCFRDIENDVVNLGTGVETGALEQSVILAKIEQDLLPKYESLRSGITSTEGNRATKRQLEKRLDENIENLKNIENDLKKHNYTDLSEFKKRVCELEYYYTHYEQVRQIITLGGRTSDIHAIIDSKQDAKRVRRYKKSDAKYQQSMNAILHDVALTSLWNDDMEKYEEYLEAVINGQVEPSSHPFYQTHCQSFSMIEHTNPSLYQMLAPSGNGRIQYVVPVAGGIDGGVYSSNRRVSSGQSGKFPARLGKGFGEVLSSIFPSIENNPRQKQAWEQAGSLLAVGGAIFMGVKLIQNIFSKKESNPNKRGKAAGWGAGLLALMNGDRIVKGGKNWIQDAFNRHPAEKIQVSTELFKKYGFSDIEALKYAEMQVGAPVALMSALHFIPIYDINTQKIVEYKNNEFQFNYDNYKRYINTYDRTNEQKKVVLAAGQKLKDDKLTNLGFAGLCIKDGNQFAGLAHGSETKTLADCPEIQEAWEENSDLLASHVNVELFNQGLMAKDTEAHKKIVEEYNQKGGQEDITHKDLKDLMIKWLKGGLLKINGDVGYDLEDMLKDPNVNLQNKTMKGFKHSGGREIEFDSYKELFDIVRLTKEIKKTFTGRDTANGSILDIIRTGNRKDDKPFHIAAGGRIEFNDHNFWEIWKNGVFRGDTDALKALTLQKISDTLKGNKQFYCDYLNERRVNDGQHGRM